MKLTLIASLLLVTAATMPLAAQAGVRKATPKDGATPVSQHAFDRVTNQNKRVQAGVQSGALTSQQSQHFTAVHEQVHQQLAADAAANGGTATAAEKAKANARLGMESRTIRKAKTAGAVNTLVSHNIGG